MVEARRIEPLDDEAAETWVRVDDHAPEGSVEHWMHLVEAWRPEDDAWRVVIALAEWVREEPQESLLCDGMAAALGRVPGVTKVWHEDTEQWVAEGDVAGSALVVAAAEFLDAFIDIEGDYLAQFLR